MDLKNFPGIKERVALAPYTTFKIGGPADFILEAHEDQELIGAFRAARTEGIPHFILGSGSNILVADRGFRGLVIRNEVKNLKIARGGAVAETGGMAIRPRLAQVDEDRFYVFEEGTVSYGEPVYVEVGSGWGLEELARELFSKDIVGLEPFAGIPGTVGGAVYTNAHGGTRFFGDRVAGALILNRQGESERVERSYFGFDYDRSRLRETGDAVLSVTLELWQGDGQKASGAFDQWKERKIRQPKRSAGCVFQNLTPEQQEKLGIPTNSVGYVLEKLLRLKGKSIGDAQISDYHAAFIVNCGNAEASQVRDLINFCKQRALEELGIALVEEIQYVGFE